MKDTSDTGRASPLLPPPLMYPSKQGDFSLFGPQLALTHILIKVYDLFTFGRDHLSLSLCNTAGDVGRTESPCMVTEL